MVSFTATFTRVVAKVSVVFKAARTKAFRDEYSAMVGKTPDDYANEFIKFVTGKVTGGTEDDVLVAAITLHHKSGNCKNWSGWLQSHTTVAAGLVGAAGLTKLLDDGLLVWQKKSTSPAGKFNCNVLRGVMPEYRITMDVLTNMLATADERYRMVLRSEHLCSMNVSDSVKALNKVEQMSFTINTLKGKWTSAHELMFETKSRAMVAFPNPTNVGESDVDVMTQTPLGEAELRQWIEAVAAKKQGQRGPSLPKPPRRTRDVLDGIREWGKVVELDERKWGGKGYEGMERWGEVWASFGRDLVVFVREGRVSEEWSNWALEIVDQVIKQENPKTVIESWSEQEVGWMGRTEGKEREKHAIYSWALGWVGFLSGTKCASTKADIAAPGTFPVVP